MLLRLEQTTVELLMDVASKFCKLGELSLHTCDGTLAAAINVYRGITAFGLLDMKRALSLFLCATDGDGNIRNARSEYGV